MLRRFVDALVGIGFQVPRGGLLDVLNAPECLGISLLQSTDELQKVFDIRTSLVEVQGIPPRCHAPFSLDAASHCIDAKNALHIPSDVRAIELDLEMSQAVEADPFAERFRKAVAKGTGNVRLLEGVESAHEMIERKPAPRSLQHVTFQMLPLKVRAKIVIEIARQKRTTVR